MTEDEISYRVIGIALEIHKALGSGLLESAYEAALVYDLTAEGLKVQSQLDVPFVYKDLTLDVGYRIDLLVEDIVLIEIKSVAKLVPVHFSQTLTYLWLSGLKLGPLMNFNTQYLKDGTHRVVNNL